MPAKVGIGQFQPYGRFTSIQPDHGSKREEIEAGVNYVIDGFNAHIAAYYQHGDLRTKGLELCAGCDRRQGGCFQIIISDANVKFD